MQKMMCLTIALAALTACFETEEKEVLPPDSDWSAIVTIVDEAGEAFAADEAFWYLPPGTDDTGAEYDLACLDESDDEGCTVFGVPADVSGLFYVAARYQRDSSEFCWDTAYDATSVAIDGEDETPVEITLVLEVMLACE